MIDIASESLIPLHEVPQRLPPRPSGRPIHMSTVYRWIQRGVRGTRLESIRIGGTTYTSIEALQRFADRQSQTSTADPAVLIHTSRSRQREIGEAARRVEIILRRRADGRADSSRG